LIVIDPRPEERAFSSTSVDLTLDPILSEFKHEQNGIEQAIDPTHPGFNYEKVMTSLTVERQIDERDGYLLQSHRPVLAWTKEYVDLRHDARLAARVEGKSSLARLGLTVHITAPTIHAGFDGKIRLEIVNHGPVPIRLRPGMRFCQLIFEQTFGTPDSGYRGQFSGQGSARRA
jgi:dCTP deaminase